MPEGVGLGQGLEVAVAAGAKEPGRRVPVRDVLDIQQDLLVGCI